LRSFIPSFKGLEFIFQSNTRIYKFYVGTLGFIVEFQISEL